MYDPVALSKKTEDVVVDGDRKKYHRFRATGFYGGIATADTVGCNLRCRFCWSSRSVWNAKSTGELYAPREVADRLHEIAWSKGFRQVRVSGGEPTIGQEHLLKLLEIVDTRLLFILETNGILLGVDESYVKALSQFQNLHVRVCLKGCNQEEFSLLTGAETGFEYQMKALEQLRDNQLRFNIALVTSGRGKKELFDRFLNMDLGHVMVEEEEIKLYPLVKKRLEQEGLLDYFEKG